MLKVAIVMGSDSDWPVLEAAGETLAAFGVEFEAAVASAHRAPELVRDFATGAKGRGIGVIIAAAGAAAHLPGVVASYTNLPVIGVPVNSTPLGGMDALLSIAQMPAGIPVACMAINGAKNAALLAVEILAVGGGPLAEKLNAYRARLKEEAAGKTAKLKKRLQEK
ncbi:MAG: 5-(carboxyamino)imidazole ribonucleotide mutase [Acidaminococcales bacterium]|jgi:5-(carboxyamino)imidazole ribonucleotide mutase|nr:5-(carboxyamino)imidazole ribonucleotide mutase [Acidaminococcales bacterium]